MSNPTPLEGEDELRRKLFALNLIKDNKYTPKNVVLVTVDDIIEVYHELAPYSMAKLDEARQHVSTKEREARIDENLKWKEVAEEIVEKDGVYRAVNYLNQRLAHLNAKEKDV